MSGLTTPIAGYRPLQERTASLVNANKHSEERVLRTIDELQQDPDVDKRWLALARTQIEQGFMALNRSIFKPTRVTLPEDDA